MLSSRIAHVFSSRPRSARERGALPRRFRPELAPLEGRALLSTLVVQNLNDSGAGSLRAEIGLAQDGDTIKFAGGLKGTITLTSGPLLVTSGVEIKGPGADKLTVSGGGTSGVFLVESPYDDPMPPPIVVNMSGITISGGDLNNVALINFGATMALKNVTVTANQGGGIANYFGTMTLTSSAVVGNTSGIPGQSFWLGGGITNAATLNVVNSDVSGNIALGNGAMGGGIISYFGSTLTVTNSTLRNNQAQGVYPAAGGAIHSDPGSTVTLSRSTFSGNLAINTPGAGGYSQGGALDVNGNTIISDCEFTNNQAVGATSPDGYGGYSSGGAINTGGTLTVAGSSFTGNQAVGAAGGGWALGGAINATFAGRVDIANSAFVGNGALGGAGLAGGYGVGGFAYGGAVNGYATPFTIASSSFLGNQAVGGAGTGAGNSAGRAFGGAIVNESQTLNMTGSLLMGNQAIGGAGRSGAVAGEARGGAIESDFGSVLNVSGSSLIGNTVQGGRGGGNGSGGGIYSGDSATTLTDTLITLNFALGGDGGGQGIGGGLFIGSGTMTLKGKTKVIANLASTYGNNIYGTVGS